MWAYKYMLLLPLLSISLFHVVFIFIFIFQEIFDGEDDDVDEKCENKMRCEMFSPFQPTIPMEWMMCVCGCVYEFNELENYFRIDKLDFIDSHFRIRNIREKMSESNGWASEWVRERSSIFIELLAQLGGKVSRDIYHAIIHDAVIIISSTSTIVKNMWCASMCCTNMWPIFHLICHSIAIWSMWKMYVCAACMPPVYTPAVWFSFNFSIHINPVMLCYKLKCITLFLGKAKNSIRVHRLGSICLES